VNLICAGRSLLLLARREGDHLWFVLTDPDANTGHVVMAMLVTSRPHTDKTIALVPGDHPFVQHESNIDYGSARFVPAQKLSQALVAGSAELRADMAPALLHEALCGLITSSRTANYILDYCRPRYAHLCP
jgi:hypothetical protein